MPLNIPRECFAIHSAGGSTSPRPLAYCFNLLQNRRSSDPKMHRTIANLLSKRITIPKLSPTHTQARIIRFEALAGDDVVAYDPVLIVECSPDMITPGFRESPDHTVQMLVDTQDEGVVSDLRTDLLGKWLDVDTPVGAISDGDPMDGNWIWQAYLHNEE